MLKTSKQFFSILLLVGLLMLPYFVFAGNAALNTLESVGVTNGGYAEAGETSAAEFAGTIISAFLSLLGVIFLILMLYSGYNWMIAHGDEQKVNKAKDTLRTSIIGLIIVLSSFAIYYFVWDNLIRPN
jgi:cytochrome bd-type quinol oxidase subunit 2